MSVPNYRFECKIIDADTGETVISDNTYMMQIDQFGGCESVDITIGRMMRQFKKTAQQEYERAL